MADLFPRVYLSPVLVLAFTAATAYAQPPGPPPVPSGPLTLEQVLELAEARSESIAIAETGVRRAEGDEVRARSGRLPQLTASASYDRALASEFSSVFGSGSSGPPCAPFTLTPGAPLNDRVAEIERAIDCGAIGNSFFGEGSDAEVDLPFGRKNTWRVNLAFSQSIYSGGRLGAQQQIASAGRDSAVLGVAGARAQLRFDVTRAFYDAALSERLVQIAEATIAQADATVQQVQASFEAGAQPEFELLRARVARDNQRPIVIRERANRDIAMLRLRQLLDLAADQPLQLAAAALDGPSPATPAPDPDVNGRNAVKETATLVRLREASLRAVLAERRPNVSVTSTYGNVTYPSQLFPTGDFRTNWTVGASVEVPILTGGRQRGSEQVARAELDQSRLQLQQMRELAQLDASAADAEMNAARASFEASAGTVEQARRAYQIAEVRYQSGVSTQLELADARLLLRQAEANRAQAARDLRVAQARLLLLPDLPLGAAGGLTSTQAPAATTTPSSGSQGSQGAAATQGRPGGGNQ